MKTITSYSYRAILFFAIQCTTLSSCTTTHVTNKETSIVLSNQKSNVTTNQRSKIMWVKNQPIKFEDFIGTIPTNNKHAAHITTHISFNLYDSAHYTLAAFMNCNYSWSKTKSPFVLKHEQYHFNITELFARNIRKKIIENKMTMRGTEFLYFYSDQMNEFREFQAKYDSLTKHGLNKIVQATWELNIENGLTALEKYENHIIPRY